MKTNQLSWDIIEIRSKRVVTEKKTSIGLKATEEFPIITCSQFLIEMTDFVLVARRVAL